MAVYKLNESHNGIDFRKPNNYTSKYWDTDYRIVSKIFPIDRLTDNNLNNFSKEYQIEIVNTVREALDILHTDMSIEDIMREEYVFPESTDEVLKDTLSDIIRDEFLQEESNCDGTLTPYLNNLYRLMYSEDFKWW